MTAKSFWWKETLLKGDLLQHFDFPWTPAAKTTRLQKLVGCFRPRLSPDAQNRAFAKHKSCTQILDRALTIIIFFLYLHALLGNLTTSVLDHFYTSTHYCRNFKETYETKKGKFPYRNFKKLNEKYYNVKLKCIDWSLATKNGDCVKLQNIFSIT